MSSQIPNPKSHVPNRRGKFALVLAPIFFACCLSVAHAQPKPAAGALEVVLAGKPVRKTLTFTTTQPARIEALEQTPIHSKLATYVGEVLVDFGDQVKKGQPLV